MLHLKYTKHLIAEAGGNGAVGVITNGSEDSQLGKLRGLGLTEWMPPELIFISDACGIMKPAPELFRMAQRAAGDVPCVFVGDSLTQDIAGAAACGWTTVWFNRRREALCAVQPDYTVLDEDALAACLRAIAEGREAEPDDNIGRN